MATKIVYVLEYRSDKMPEGWQTGTFLTADSARSSAELMRDFHPPGFFNAYRVSEALIEEGEWINGECSGPVVE